MQSRSDRRRLAFWKFSWSASFRMPFELGKVVILEYIKVALGKIVVNDIGVASFVSKRKVWRRGQIVHGG